MYELFIESFYFTKTFKREVKWEGFGFKYFELPPKYPKSGL